jgi:hypothetical protein
MGKFVPTGPEQAVTVVTGTLASVAQGTSVPLLGNFNVAVWGTFVGSLTLVNSYDGGTTWIPVINKHTGGNIVFAAAGALQEDEVEPGVLYALQMTAYTSGTANYRISEGAAAGRIERLS